MEASKTDKLLATVEFTSSEGVRKTSLLAGAVSIFVDGWRERQTKRINQASIVE